MIYKSLALLVVCFLANSSYCQELISAAGEANSNDELTIEWSLGEVSVATISTPTLVLSQGIHQGLGNKVVSGINLKELTLTAYPNPTSDELKIDLPTEVNLSDNWSYMLLDQKGATLLSKPISGHQESVSLTGFKSSTYLLQILQNDRIVENFRIIKSN
ncbi:MAG: T9SS type A sorting domain-containing protein [Cyclobacteriaceae bacterium]